MPILTKTIGKKQVLIPWKLWKLWRSKIAKETTDQRWKEIQLLQKEISKRWQGPQAVEEIRDQRTKKYNYK